MSWSDRFTEILTPQELLAPLTHLGLGGPAEFVARPQSLDQLRALLADCRNAKVPARVLGTGSRLVVGDDGVAGVVIVLTGPEFRRAEGEGNRLTVGAGLTLGEAIQLACSRGLSGMETLVGLPGSMGGSIRNNSGDRFGEIGDLVRSVRVIDRQGLLATRQRDELDFSEGRSNVDDPVIVSVELELQPDQEHAIAQRMKRAWIQRKATRPHLFQRSIRAFRNPSSFRAAQLIDNAGFRPEEKSVGGAVLSDRNTAYIVAQPGSTAGDVLELMTRVEQRVQHLSGVRLEREAILW